MSQRSINFLRAKAAELGLGEGSFVRRYRYSNPTRESHSGAYFPDHGPLGWFFIGDDGKELHLGYSLDEALAYLGGLKKAA